MRVETVPPGKKKKKNLLRRELLTSMKGCVEGNAPRQGRGEEQKTPIKSGYQGYSLQK